MNGSDRRANQPRSLQTNLLSTLAMMLTRGSVLRSGAAKLLTLAWLQAKVKSFGQMEFTQETPGKQPKLLVQTLSFMVRGSSNSSNFSNQIL